MQFSKAGSENTIIYGEALYISSIALQREIYQQALALAKPITLKASAINGTDTASLQLLLSFLLAAKQQGMSYQWHDCSLSLIQSIQLLGIEHLCDLPKSN